MTRKLSASERYNAGRTAEAEVLGRDVAAALVRSPMAYTAQVARAAARFIADPTGTAVFAELVTAVATCHKDMKLTARLEERLAEVEGGR